MGDLHKALIQNKIKLAQMKMKMHLPMVPGMIFVILNAGAIECEDRGLKALFVEMWNKIDTILTHTGILVSNVLLPITVQVEPTISFDVEIGTITFLDSVNCPPITLNEKVSPTNCSPRTARGACLITSITAKNSE